MADGEFSEFTRECWTCREYLNTTYETADNQPCDDFLISNLETLHQFWDVIGTNLKKDICYLDFGCGAAMANVMSASRVASEIYMSDFSDDACIQVQKWIEKDKDAVDWSFTMKKISELEMNRPPVEAVMERLRSKIKKVVHCDILKDDPLEGSDVPRVYDVISAMHCIRVPCLDLPTYTNGVRKLADMLKPGGYFLLGVDYNQNYWIVGNNKYHVLSLSEKDVQEAITNAGLVIEEDRKVFFPQVDDYDGTHSSQILARKPLARN